MSLPLIDDYLLSLLTNNYSEETRYNYERDLKVFEDFLSTEINKSFDELTKKDINTYKAYLNSRDRVTPLSEKGTKYLSSFSINRMLSALRSYLKFLIEMDTRPPIFPENIRLTKTIKKHPKVAELEELVKLIESPTTLEKNPKIALRNRVMLEILFSTGLRISELINLKRNQINKSGKIFVLGKGKKERFVYLTPRAKKHLETYLKICYDDSPYLFIPYQGRNIKKKDKKISPNYLQAKIKEYRELLDINIPISAHSLRHGFATYLAEQGASAVAIQILLGHESLSTTTRYVHASDRYAQKSHQKYHPLK